MNALALALVATAATSSAVLTGALGLSPSDSPDDGGLQQVASPPEAMADGQGAASWPVQPPDLERGFEGPEQYGPGHRGVDLLAWPGQVVRSALPGRVGFVGRVAGRSIVVVDHEGGLRTTYLPVNPLVQAGDRIRAGDRVGRLTAEPHCPTTSCLHWGARWHDTYIDPLSLLPGRVVLLPVDS